MNFNVPAISFGIEENCGSVSGKLEWDIREQRFIQADIRRVFHAVSMSEYREAWIRPPNADDRCCIVAGQADAAYRIELYRANLLEASIAGLIQKWESEEMIFTWQKKPSIGSTETIVHIRLHNEAEGSAMELVHSGFSSAADVAWHQQLWDASLERLAWLLEGFPV
jgi:uncharacterized protein YndB with AHSA1/START domain